MPLHTLPNRFIIAQRGGFEQVPSGAFYKVGRPGLTVLHKKAALFPTKRRKRPRR